MEDKSLDEQLQAWLKERNATLIILAVGAKGGAVTVDNFISANGLQVPVGWGLSITAVEAKGNDANSPI